MSRGTGIVMISGGLDSLLAIRVLMEQDIDLIGFHCVLPFVDPAEDTEKLPAVLSAKKQGIFVQIHRCDQEYIDIVRNPPHGYGKRANPCIDCHIYFLKKAAKYMHKIGADFVATGEVVGQRPMSQMRGTMNHIEKESGLIGRLLRPLSAKLMRPTIPEIEGVVDRDRLHGINGRSRKVQLELARHYGIVEYETPSGGCLFTDVNISRRVHDLFGHHRETDAVDMYLLSIGRHFRISNTTKIIVGRNKIENEILQKHMAKADLLYLPQFKGPTIYVKGDTNRAERELIGRVLIHYGKDDTGKRIIKIHKHGFDQCSVEIQGIEDDSDIESMRI